MPHVEFEPATSVFQRAKTVHVLDRAATVVGKFTFYRYQQSLKYLRIILHIPKEYCYMVQRLNLT
jgi:hypothetical protein